MNIEIGRLNESELAPLHEIERLTQLTFWGWESYRSILKDDDFIFARVAHTSNNGTRQLIGFIIARFMEQEAEIMKIGVHPQYQNSGVGGRLLTVALNEAAARGCMVCYLEVRRSNRTAIQFYQTHQFDFCGFRKNYYAGPLEDAYVMRRTLAKAQQAGV